MPNIDWEIPETKQGLTLYISYAEVQIKRNNLHNGRLRKRMQMCQDKLNKITKDQADVETF